MYVCVTRATLNPHHIQLDNYHFWVLERETGSRRKPGTNTFESDQDVFNLVGCKGIRTALRWFRLL